MRARRHGTEAKGGSLDALELLEYKRLFYIFTVIEILTVSKLEYTSVASNFPS